MILRPLARGDEEELRRIHATAEVARWWDAPGESFPWEEPEASRLTILFGGAVAGLIEFHEELEPKYRHASIDLFLDPALHGRGLGSEAVGLLVRHLIDDRGHHRVGSTPRARTSPPSVLTSGWGSNRWGSCTGPSAIPRGMDGMTPC